VSIDPNTVAIRLKISGSLVSIQRSFAPIGEHAQSRPVAQMASEQEQGGAHIDGPLRDTTRKKFFFEKKNQKTFVS